MGRGSSYRRLDEEMNDYSADESSDNRGGAEQGSNRGGDDARDHSADASSDDVAGILADLMIGKVVKIPTETVEGYAVRLWARAGVEELMRIKSRPYGDEKVFTLVPETVEAINRYAIIPPKFASIIAPLLNRHFPGELTIILPKNPDFKHFYYDFYDKIGFRIPNHPFFREILPKTGPLLLTSANPRGGTPYSATGHRPSTVVDFSGNEPKILRQGEIELHF